MMGTARGIRTEIRAVRLEVMPGAVVTAAGEVQVMAEVVGAVVETEY